MVRDIVNVGRKEALVFVVDLHGRICPPQECLEIRCSVKQSDAKFNQRRIGLELHSMHSFQPVQRVMFRHPSCDRTITRSFDRPIGRHKRSRAMMLRPVKLYAAGNPWTGQTDQRRFNHFLVIEDVIVIVGLILDRMNAASELGKEQHANEIIFQPDRPVAPNFANIEYLINKRQRIDLAI